MSEAELLCRPPVASVFSEDGFALGKDTYVEAGHSILWSSFWMLLCVYLSHAEESWSRRLADSSVI